ncbi:hypothetical protein ANCCAN_03113 [Ancylostoma caninum]|uniref:Tc1-like transposase DDE domain-containing protein n=1 Tax=Ancylostoma caninum TaxID=29170 RepID=A0A368H4N8_ANCCA|nr:hypothetical protein ANCCAN_03113 [Ancylostoma caninum]
MWAQLGLNISRKTMWRSVRGSCNIVIFSDENKFNLDDLDRYRHYWRDSWKEPLMFSRRNLGGGSLMTWAAFRSSRKLELTLVSVRMNSYEHQAALGTHLFPFWRHSLVFQQDNTAVHESHSTRMCSKSTACTKWAGLRVCQTVTKLRTCGGINVRHVHRNKKQYNTVLEVGDTGRLGPDWRQRHTKPSKKYATKGFIRNDDGPIDY